MKRNEFLKSLLALGALSATAPFSFSQTPTPSPVDPTPSPILNPETGASPTPFPINPNFESKGEGIGNRIAITFDDGPNTGVTETVLDALDKHQVRATFFMIGQNVKARPKLAKEVADRGHEIGNHTYTHPMLSKMSDEAVHDQLYRTQQVILEATGKTPVWFRPPYGAFRKSQGHIAVALGLGIIYWSVDPQDWSRPGVQNIISRVVDHTTPGSIILMHDLHDQTAEAINTVLDGLKQKAFAFTNVTRFLGLPYV